MSVLELGKAFCRLSTGNDRKLLAMLLSESCKVVWRLFTGVAGNSCWSCWWRPCWSSWPPSDTPCGQRTTQAAWSPRPRTENRKRELWGLTSAVEVTRTAPTSRMPSTLPPSRPARRGLKQPGSGPAIAENRPHGAEPTKEVQHLFFLKVHKAASTTVLNVIYRFALSRHLVVMLPVSRLANILSERSKVWTSNAAPPSSWCWPLRCPVQPPHLWWNVHSSGAAQRLPVRGDCAAAFRPVRLGVLVL